MSQQNSQAQYIVGVDGGGTKTHYALYESNGEAVDFLTSGATNHESLEDGMTGTRNRLNHDFSTLMKKNHIHISQVKHAALGLAGVDTKRQHRVISQMLLDIGLTDFILCNDAYLGVKAGCPSGFGICAINGTGFSVGGIDIEGKLVQIGGFGSMSGDLGGGGQYSTDAFKAVYEHIYKDAPNTLLQKKIFDYANITDEADFPEKLLEAIAEDKCDFSVIGRFVFDAADEGDIVSKDLIMSSTKEYARSISAAIDQLNFSSGEQLLPIEVALAGSVFVKGYNKEQVGVLCDLLQARHPGYTIKISKLVSPPVLGALLWAFEPLFEKNKMPEHFRNSITESLHRFL